VSTRAAESVLRLHFVRPRAFGIEAVLASAALAVAMILWEKWIEIVFFVDLDRGEGVLERAIAATLLVLAFCVALRARMTWCRDARVRTR
jgi:hypothetical protein